MRQNERGTRFGRAGVVVKSVVLNASLQTYPARSLEDKLSLTHRSKLEVSFS